MKVRRNYSKHSTGIIAQECQPGDVYQALDTEDQPMGEYLATEFDGRTYLVELGSGRMEPSGMFPTWRFVKCRAIAEISL